MNLTAQALHEAYKQARTEVYNKALEAIGLSASPVSGWEKVGERERAAYERMAQLLNEKQKEEVKSE